jgi:hypothetical protein
LTHVFNPSAKGALICTYTISYNEIIFLSYFVHCNKIVARLVKDFA